MTAGTSPLVDHRPGPGPRQAKTVGRSSGGFTLIEVIVAFTIMALALAALLQSFATGLRNLGMAESYTGAALRARSKLAEIGQILPLEAGEQSGELDDGFQWHALIEPYAPAVPEGVPGDPRLSGQRVEVPISWAGGRAVSLSTLRLVRQQ
jgi:general secretion pathway protein I